MSGYDLPVPSGTYRVTLGFAEISPCCDEAGERIFDVSLEGMTVADDFDIQNQAGTFQKTTISRLVTVGDGRLDVDFPPVVGAPKLSTIEVIDAYAGEADDIPPPVIEVTDQEVVEGVTLDHYDSPSMDVVK